MGGDEPLFGAAAEPEDPPAGPGTLLIVEADGGSRGNPGHAGYGALVRDPESGEIIREKAAYLGKVSNNVAEYSGLVAGLELAREINPAGRIHVKMDSKLVVEQMSGRWQIKHADMRSLAAKARRVIDPRQVTYEWIPREKNKDADRLSNEAMDAGVAGVPWAPRLAQPTTSAPAAAPAAASRPAADAAPRRASAENASAVQMVRLHHVEIWVPDLGRARASFGWLFERLGFTPKDAWEGGFSYASGTFYVVVEAGPDVLAAPHERRRPGVNHLAFSAGSRDAVELLARRASSHGWNLLYRDRHPFAGGAAHYAAYLENADGFEIELVAEDG